MTRMLAFVAALLLTAITVSSACVAQSATPLRFTIEPAHSGQSTDMVQVKFDADDKRGSHDWSSSFRKSELVGLDIASLDSTGTRPLAFAVVRDAGRIDCNGTGGNGLAKGVCALTPNADYQRYLADRNVERPTEEQSFGLVALDVHRELVDALARNNYPTPTIDDLMGLTAVGATPDYIAALASQGYRPKTLEGLVEFAALKVTPDFIGSFVRAGYSKLDPEELVQLRALGITPEFVAGFERIGYRGLPVETLVQLKALDITPDFVRAVQQGDALPSPEKLVQLRALGREYRNR